jgi:hypothetical protein
MIWFFLGLLLLAGALAYTRAPFVLCLAVGLAWLVGVMWVAIGTGPALFAAVVRRNAACFTRFPSSTQGRDLHLRGEHEYQLQQRRRGRNGGLREAGNRRLPRQRALQTAGPEAQRASGGVIWTEAPWQES